MPQFGQHMIQKAFVLTKVVPEADFGEIQVIMVDSELAIVSPCKATCLPPEASYMFRVCASPLSSQKALLRQS